MAGTVLVIEDDQVVREGMHAILERAGYVVVFAANGSQALTYLNSKPAPGLIILDMMMPAMDGWTFMATLRQNPAWTTIPAIIATGMGIACSEWAKSLGAHALLKKPFTADELVEAVRQICKSTA